MIQLTEKNLDNFNFNENELLEIFNGLMEEKTIFIDTNNKNKIKIEWSVNNAR